MIELGPQVAIGLPVGAAIAGVVFSGLSWTIRRLPRARHPGLLLSASLLIRLGAGLGGLLLLALVGGAALIAGCVAFFGARLLIVRRERARWPATRGG